METCATTPYRITGSDGGKSSPSEPEAVTRPTEKPSGYLSSRSVGRSRPPSARMVTPGGAGEGGEEGAHHGGHHRHPPGIQPKIPL